MNMNKKDYNKWIAKLAQSDDPDTAEIGKKAQQSAWKLESIRNNVPTAIEFIKEEMFIEDEDEWERTLKEGWISIHGRLIAIWSDSI